MKDLIEREKVLEAFLTKGSGYYNMMTLRDMINAIPSVDILTDKDVQPVRRGKWIAIDDVSVRGKCSACQWEAHLYEDDVFGMPYCPNCGADMRGEDNG